MPGIAGIILKGDQHREAESSRDLMVKTMTHESFFVSGTHSEADLGVHVGWSIHQGTFSDCLPVWNEEKNVCLVFSGEDFSDLGEINVLRTKGHRFNNGNASRIVHLYEEHGPAFLERLNGWFSGLLVDLQQRTIILFNDRYGFNRLYYHENAQGFYFASEAKALLEVLPDLRKLDNQSLGEVFACGCALQNRTMFSGIQLVPGGAAWAFSPGRPAQKGFYFNRRVWEQLPQLSGGDYDERLRACWQKILPRYFYGTESIGLSLTGGLDSRMILAWAPRGPGELPCYTFGGPYRDCADVVLSRRVAQICRQPHVTVALDQDFLAQFPALVERTTYLTDGTLDPTGTADLFLQSKARQIGRIRVTGFNGGELLRRLIMFKPATLPPGLLAPEFSGQVAAATRTYTSELQGHRLSFILFKQAPWYLYARLALERSQLTIRTPYFDNELAALAYQAPNDRWDAGPALQLIAEGRPALKNLGTDRALLLKSILGLTQLQHQFQEFTFKAEYAYDYGMPQWVAKLDHALAPLHLEKLFLGRHKFYHFRIWYRDHFSKYLKAVLLDPQALSRPYLNGRFLEHMVLAHVSGRANYTTEIHRALTAELMQQQLLDPR